MEGLGCWRIHARESATRVLKGRGFEPRPFQSLDASHLFPALRSDRSKSQASR